MTTYRSVRYQYGCRQCVVASFLCFSDRRCYCRSFRSFLLPVPFALFQVMLSRCKCMADWKLIAKCALKELQQAVAPLLLNEVGRLRGGERSTMKQDGCMVHAYLAELDTIERYMTTCLAEHPQQLGLLSGGENGSGENRSAAERFNNALENIEPLRMGLEGMLSPKAKVGTCDECKGLEPLRRFASVKQQRAKPGKPARLVQGTRRLCGECEHLDRTGQLYRPCRTCGLLYQPFLTHDPVEPGQLRSEEDSPHEGCMQRRCKCGEGDYCPPDADAAPVVGATPTPAPSAWGTATSAALPASWGSVDVPPFPGLQQEEKQPADPPSDPAAGGSSRGGNAPAVDGSDATEDED